MTIFFIFILSLSSYAQQPAPAAFDCRQGMVEFGGAPNRGVANRQPLCTQDPGRMVAELKQAITQYLCLYHADLECLQKNQAFLASRRNQQGNFAQDFERMVGSQYLNSWLRNSNNHYYHPGLASESSLFPDETQQNSGITTDVVQILANFVPGGVARLASIGTSVFGTFQTMGRSSTGTDPGNDCTIPRNRFINAQPVPDSRGSASKICSPSYNFNSNPVADFLKQDPQLQATGLVCADVCLYYAQLLSHMNLANLQILGSVMPIFSQRPQCLAGGRASFSFCAMRESLGGFSGDVNWNCLDNRGQHISHTGRMVLPLEWSVTTDLIARSEVQATVSPTYNLDSDRVTMRVPTIPRMRAGASPPAAVAAPIGGLASYETREGITLRDAFHRTQYAIGSGPQVPLLSLRGDPALRGMGIASAVVSGCCSVPEPNREQCLRALPTTEMYRPRDRNEETAIPTNN